ncbi:hypothetical protein E9840_07835 [Tissierella creatinini]|nr:hypothetical protein E9840_07835 [Tissierella creatinini]TJX66718.1 hypothetical protein E8P77_06990 [Soehngenia saccharolytica]
MRITDLQYQRNKKRINVFIDNEFSFGIDEELKFKYSIHIDDEISPEFIEDIIRAEEQLKSNNQALRLLSFRQRSEKEIEEALRRKGYNEENILHTIDYLKRNKYIDDEYFTKSFIGDKQNLNGYGSQRIKYELIKKGISKELIENYLLDNPDEEYELALKIASKKLKSYREEDKNSIWNKLGGYLQRKGYSYEIVSKVLRTLLEDR